MIFFVRRVKIKICCIASIEEAKMAISYGANILGLVGNMPSGPGIINDALIAKIANYAPALIDTFLLSSFTKAEDIITHHKKVNTTTIQLVDAIAINDYAIIKKELPKVKLVQVIHVIDKCALQQAIEISPLVDVILLDSGNPNLTVKELGGGTGRTHNWQLSKQIVAAVTKPVYLAGGLTAKNVQAAITIVQHLWCGFMQRC